MTHFVSSFGHSSTLHGLSGSLRSGAIRGPAGVLMSERMRRLNWALSVWALSACGEDIVTLVPVWPDTHHGLVWMPSRPNLRHLSAMSKPPTATHSSCLTKAFDRGAESPPSMKAIQPASPESAPESRSPASAHRESLGRQHWPHQPSVGTIIGQPVLGSVTKWPEPLHGGTSLRD